MATASSISVTEGSGKNIASHSFSETTTKELQRIELNNSSGVEIGVAATPIQVSLANSAANATAVKVDNSAVSQPVIGPTASGASLTVAPVTTGGLAKTANPTAVTDGQVVNALFDKLGKQVVVGAVRDLKGITQTSVSNTTSETTIIAAVASTFLDLYGLILANTGATTTKVTIKDATSGTTRAIIEVPTLETRGFMLPVDSAIPQAAVNNNWTVTCGSATTALEVTAFWVKNI